MPWYKSGTVSVTLNSNAIIGNGTAFILNGRVGDAFIGPDGEIYEVANIASDTALAISPPYKSPSNTSGVFAIVPIQGYVKDTADALRAASGQIADSLGGLDESVQAAAGSASAAQASENAAAQSETNSEQSAAAALASKSAAEISETNAGQSAAAALSSKNAAGASETDAASSAAAALASKNAAAISEQNTANKAASGANSDITSLSGLTTALSITQGGTGRSDGLAWGNLKGSLASQSDLQAVLDAKSSLGVGQSWQDMTTSRALATTYTNTTGKPIQVSVFATGANATTTALGTTVASAPAIFGNPAALAAGGISTGPVIIPAGSTYSVAVNVGSASLFRWMELRQ